MIYAIQKIHTQERISYYKIDDEKVRKCHYDLIGNRTKEKEISVKEIHRNRPRYKDTEDFFEDMIWNHGYSKLN